MGGGGGGAGGGGKLERYLAASKRQRTDLAHFVPLPLQHFWEKSILML